jgi:hypothetical protein
VRIEDDDVVAGQGAVTPNYEASANSKSVREQATKDFTDRDLEFVSEIKVVYGQNLVERALEPSGDFFEPTVVVHARCLQALACRCKALKIADGDWFGGRAGKEFPFSGGFDATTETCSAYYDALRRRVSPITKRTFSVDTHRNTFR